MFELIATFFSRNIHVIRCERNASYRSKVICQTESHTSMLSGNSSGSSALNQLLSFSNTDAVFKSNNSKLSSVAHVAFGNMHINMSAKRRPDLLYTRPWDISVWVEFVRSMSMIEYLRFSRIFDRVSLIINDVLRFKCKFYLLFLHPRHFVNVCCMLMIYWPNIAISRAYRNLAAFNITACSGYRTVHVKLIPLHIHISVVTNQQSMRLILNQTQMRRAIEIVQPLLVTAGHDKNDHHHLSVSMRTFSEISWLDAQKTNLIDIFQLLFNYKKSVSDWFKQKYVPSYRVRSSHFSLACCSTFRGK